MSPDDRPRIEEWRHGSGTLVPGPRPMEDPREWTARIVLWLSRGWTAEGSILGAGLIVDSEQPCVGVVTFNPLDEAVVELSYGIAEPFRSRGLASRAARVASAWALRDGGFHRVELRIDASHGASRRVAEKAGFAFVEEFETLVEGTGQVARDTLWAMEGEQGGA